MYYQGNLFNNRLSTYLIRRSNERDWWTGLNFSQHRSNALSFFSKKAAIRERDRIKFMRRRDGRPKYLHLNIVEITIEVNNNEA